MPRGYLYFCGTVETLLVESVSLSVAFANACNFMNAMIAI